MAKAPQAGHAKTRLIPLLGAAGAARLAQRMLDHAVAQACAANLGDVVELCCTPDPTHPAFTAHAAHGVRLSAQGEGDLGVRMHAALARALAQAPRAILIGTDIPALDAAYLRAAAAALDDPAIDVVLGPAADGGYTLVGLRRAAPQLFDAMPWSTGRVLALTRERLAASGLRHVELAPLCDVDEPADLADLPAGWLS